VTDRHLALVVEDDPATSENLLEIVGSLDCDAMSTDNKETAIELLAQHVFCFVLLDLQIKSKPDSIKGHTAHGNALLREIRTKCGGNRGSPFWTPILVISGYAEEVDAAVEMMKNGADDIIRKPPLIADVSKRIRAALQQAGRELHAACSANVGKVVDSARIIVGFPADREGLRTTVTIAGREVLLPDSSLKIFLQLAIAHQEGKFVHQRKLGARRDQGFKGISRLRQELRSVLAKGIDIIDNDRHGGYSLKHDVKVAECDVVKLRALGDAQIAQLAETLAGLVKAHREADGI
jgi:DNA-binding response OmpR family regulator